MGSTFEQSRATNPLLQAQTSPPSRIPFSSPMGPEILSPTSPTTTYSPRLRRKQSRESMQGDNTSNPRRFSIHKASKPTSPRKQSKSPNRTRWPELNVVTNFSKPPILAKRAADASLRKTRDAFAGTDERKDGRVSRPQQNFGARQHGRGQKTDGAAQERGKSGSDNLKKISATDYNSQAMMKDAAGLGLQPFDQGGNTIPSAGDTKGPIHDLRRAPSKGIELSPSDRLIAIGITVTPTSLADRTMSPEDGKEKSPGLVVQQFALTRGSPGAPSIILTPAKEGSPWSTPNQQYVAYRPRPASSVYSRATQRGRTVTQPSSTPPVPLLPGLSSFPKQPNVSEPVDESGKSISPSRVVSGCTIFEDDDSPPAGFRDDQNGGKPHLRLLSRASTDTIATKHRSQGWWNYLISPFSAKPNGNFNLFKDGVDKAVISSPHSSEATKIGEDDEDTKSYKKDDLSPVTSISDGSGSSHTSIWTDRSSHLGERGPIGLAFDHTPRASEIVRNWPREIIGTDLSDLPRSPETLSPEGFGAAAEYYQACLHDQNSPTPYFECQNHICFPTTKGEVVEGRGLEGERGLENIAEEPNDLTGSHSTNESGQEDPAANSPEKLKPVIFQQTPGNRFSAAFKESIDRSASKRRPTSGNTIIEDLDTTPAVEEAQVAPILRAGNPTPALRSRAIWNDGKSENGSNASPQLPSASDKAEPGPARGLPQSPEPKPGRGLPQSLERGTPPALEAPRQPVPSQLPATKELEEPKQTVKTPPARKFVAVMPPNSPQQTPEPLLPPPFQRELATRPDVVPVAEPPRDIDERPVYIVNHYHGNYRPATQAEQVEATDFYPPPRPISTTNEKQKDASEKRKSSVFGKKLRGCLKLRKRPAAGEPKKKKKRCLLIAIAIGLILIIILILALALTLTRKGDPMPVQSQWLNITGFPPIPTGISTIIQPDASHEQSGCVSPTTLWSCALPKEEQASVAPNDSDQPNFRVEIRFQNGTNVSLGTNASLTKRSEAVAPNAVSAGSLIRRHLLQLRDSFSDALFTPSPAPPSLEEQAFLGNSTDDINAPFAGEFTPFFMSFESAQKLPASRLVKRASHTNSSETNTTDPFPDLTKGIPPPDISLDGTAAPAELLPFPSAQPLRLFNRGLPTEHYGFYTYFDRSIFLKSTALLNITQGTGEVPDDENGGAEETAASVRCTWAQTRFLVQIWTNKGGSASLLASGNSSTSEDKHPKNLTASSANDFSRPGSFPYPVSISLDRHGGDINKKIIYCYGMDNREHIIPDHKKVQLEDRAFGGHLVNPALGPFGHVNVTTSEGGPGGIDGGTGGCSCLWKNWDGAGS